MPKTPFCQTARIDGIEEETICVFGPEEAPPSIGAHTLEGMLLGVDPTRRRLVPRECSLMTTAAESPFRLVADYEMTRRSASGRRGERRVSTPA